MKKKKLLSILLVCGLIVTNMLSSVYALEPKKVSQSDIGVDKIISAEDRTYFITGSGEVYVSGQNRDGILGLGAVTGVGSVVDELIQIPGLTGVKDIAAGEDETYFILDSGDVYSTGLGIKQSTSPVRVDGLSGINKIAIDGDSVMALNNAGDVYIYGDNENGQLGAGTKQIPIYKANGHFSHYETVSIDEVDELTYLSSVNDSGVKVKDIQMGDGFTIMLFEDGSVKAAGRNDLGQLGFHDSNDVVTFTTLDNSVGIFINQIASGFEQTLFLSNTGTLYAVGDRGTNTGSGNSGNARKGLVELSKLPDGITDIGINKIGSAQSVFLLLSDGTVWSAGIDTTGADFSGSIGDSKDYTQVAENVLELFVGGNQTFLGLSNAEILAAGSNMYGEIPIGSHGGNVTSPISMSGIYFTGGSFELEDEEEEEEEETPIVGDDITPDMWDDLHDLDYELVLNVAQDGQKELGASLKAYQKMLQHVDNSDKNKSLTRVSKLTNIFGDSFKPAMEYGIYNLYNEFE